MAVRWGNRKEVIVGKFLKTAFEEKYFLREFLRKCIYPLWFGEGQAHEQSHSAKETHGQRIEL